MVWIAVPYAYGTIICIIRVWLYCMHIRVWYIHVPYAYGTIYAYGIEHSYQQSAQNYYTYVAIYM